MKKQIALFAVAVATLMALPAVDAQDAPATNAPATTPAPKILPFTGKVFAVDPAAKTVTIDMRRAGRKVCQVTADTKITKDGADATLADVVAEQPVNGSGTFEKDKTILTHLVIKSAK